MPTAAQQTEHIRKHEAEAATGPRNMQVAGDTAEITIDGVLTEKPDFFAWLFGGGNTTYRDIRSALAIASQDPAIKKVILNISSPGGTVAGLFDTLGVLEAFEKPITVRSSLAASAAYAIAAVAGPIQATNAAAEFGSIGVAVTYLHMEELIDITSTEAPNKRPDPSTDEGKAVIREHLDAIHDLFVDAIARGRTRATGEKLTVDTVNETFGRGAVVLAADARKRRMIDKMPAKASTLRAENQITPDAAGVPDEPAPGGKERTMSEPTKPLDLKTLKAQHPEIYEAAKQEGVTAERDRVLGHLTMGQESGDMKTAISAIESGDGMTVKLQAKYMSAAMNRRDVTARQADSDTAGAAVEGAGAAAPAAEGSAGKKDLVDVFAADLPPVKKTG